MTDNKYDIALKEGLKLGDISVSDIYDLNSVQSELDKLYHDDRKLEILDIQNNTITVQMIIHIKDFYGSIISLQKSGLILRYC
jgi:hypothetical protein